MNLFNACLAASDLSCFQRKQLTRVAHIVSQEQHQTLQLKNIIEDS